MGIEAKRALAPSGQKAKGTGQTRPHEGVWQPFRDRLSPMTIGNFFQRPILLF